MTWVCAASTIFGYGALYSDVQVTFADGHTRDLIQKAYPLSNFIAAGFAGSVRIGFALLRSLSDFLKLSPEELAVRAWDPVWVSNNWAPSAKLLFRCAPETERALGSSILMVGASPDESCGLGSKIYFTRFASPDFRPGIMSRAVKVCSIGSGAGIREYKKWIKPLWKLTNPTLQAERSHPGGWGEDVGFLISQALADHPKPGISRHIHILIIRRGEILVGTNDENIYPPDDGPRIEIRMPEIAHGYEQFCAMAKSIGHTAAGACC